MLRASVLLHDWFSGELNHDWTTLRYPISPLPPAACHHLLSLVHLAATSCVVFSLMNFDYYVAGQGRTNRARTVSMGPPCGTAATLSLLHSRFVSLSFWSERPHPCAGSGLPLTHTVRHPRAHQHYLRGCHPSTGSPPFRGSIPSHQSPTPPLHIVSKYGRPAGWKWRILIHSLRHAANSFIAHPFSRILRTLSRVSLPVITRPSCCGLQLGARNFGAYISRWVYGADTHGERNVRTGIQVR